MVNDTARHGIGRRRMLQAVGGLAAAAVAGCAGPGTVRGSGGGPRSAASAPKPVPGGPVTGDLSFAHWRAEDKAVFEQLIAAFRTANPGAKVRQDISPSNDYQSTALQKIKGGAIGDVFAAFRGSQFVNMTKAGLFTDLSAQLFVDNYAPKLARGGRDEAGRQLGLPYQLVFNMPVYNVDLFERSGVSEVPQDWDGFLSVCETLKSKGVVPIAWPGGEPANAGQLINAMVMNNAPTDDMFAKVESGEYKVTDDWFLKTLEQYVQLRPFFQPNSTGTASEPLQQLFAQGKAGMLATGSFHMAAVRKLRATFAMDLIAPITVPKDKLRYTGIHNATFLLGVSSASKQRDAALKLVEFLSQPAVATRYANGTGQHLTVDGVRYTDRDLKATEHWLNERTLLAPRFQTNDLDIRAAIENACTQVVGGTGVQQAAQKAQEIIEQRRR